MRQCVCMTLLEISDIRKIVNSKLQVPFTHRNMALKSEHSIAKVTLLGMVLQLLTSPLAEKLVMNPWSLCPSGMHPDNVISVLFQSKIGRNRAGTQKRPRTKARGCSIIYKH